MKFTGVTKLVGLAIGVSLAWQTVAQAQSPEEFYKGKTVTMVIAAATGGAADVLGRAFAPFFQKYLPGQPELIVANKPGAGGMKAASELMVSEKKDGTTITFLLSANLFNPLIENKHEQFDPRKVQWIGSIDRKDHPYAVMAWKSSPAQSAAEIFEKEVVVAATGYGHPTRVFPAILQKVAGAKFKIVPGYEGSNQVYVALERGEADAWFQTFTSIANRSVIPGKFVADGNMKPILAIGFEKHPDWPDVPSLADYVKNEQDKALLEFLFIPLKAGRPFAVPAEVPADRVAALRKAFVATFADPEFNAAMEKLLQEKVGLITGEQIEKDLATLYAAPASILEAARAELIKKE